MSDAMKGAILVTVLFVVGLASGLGLGWKLWKPSAPVVDTYAPPVRNQDGSLLLERKPETPEQAAKEIPTPTIPKGGKVERQIEVVVQPTRPASPSQGQETPAVGQNKPNSWSEPPPCPPIRVDIALVLMPDQTRRVVVSSPDGKVVGGVDIPERPEPALPKVLKSAAGLEYSMNPWGNTKSLVAQHDWSFLRFGARAGMATMTFPSGGMQRGLEAGVSVMIRF